jgi:hypothetical protein
LDTVFCRSGSTDVLSLLFEAVSDVVSDFVSDFVSVFVSEVVFAFSSAIALSSVFSERMIAARELKSVVPQTTILGSRILHTAGRRSSLSRVMSVTDRSAQPLYQYCLTSAPMEQKRQRLREALIRGDRPDVVEQILNKPPALVERLVYYTTANKI